MKNLLCVSILLALASHALAQDWDLPGTRIEHGKRTVERVFDWPVYEYLPTKPGMSPRLEISEYMNQPDLPSCDFSNTIHTVVIAQARYVVMQGVAEYEASTKDSTARLKYRHNTRTAFRLIASACRMSRQLYDDRFENTERPVPMFERAMLKWDITAIDWLSNERLPAHRTNQPDEFSQFPQKWKANLQWAFDWSTSNAGIAP